MYPVFVTTNCFTCIHSQIHDPAMKRKILDLVVAAASSTRNWLMRIGDNLLALKVCGVPRIICETPQLVLPAISAN